MKKADSHALVPDQKKPTSLKQGLHSGAFWSPRWLYSQTWEGKCSHAELQCILRTPKWTSLLLPPERAKQDQSRPSQWWRRCWTALPEGKKKQNQQIRQMYPANSVPALQLCSLNTTQTQNKLMFRRDYIGFCAKSCFLSVFCQHWMPPHKRNQANSCIFFFFFFEGSAGQSTRHASGLSSSQRSNNGGRSPITRDMLFRHKVRLLSN